jgi:hypothetical protein
MTIAFNCSSCDSPLKVGDTLAGKKCKCPKCSAVNDVPNGEITEKPKTKKVAATVATEPAKSKKKAAEEEIEELEEETPKKGKKGKKGAKGKWGMLIGGLVFLLGGGAVLSLCVCSSVGVWYFDLLPSWLGGSPSELRYLPSGTTNIEIHRLAAERDSKFYKEVDKEKPAWMREKEGTDAHEIGHGISTSNIERIVRGSTGKDSITVITTKSAVKKDDIISKMKSARKLEKMDFDEEKVKDGKYIIYKPNKTTGFGGTAFCLVSSTMVVYSGDWETIKGVLNRDKAPEWSSSMEAAMKQASFRSTHVRISAGSDMKGFFFGGTSKKDVKPEYAVMESDYGSDEKGKLIVAFKEASDANDCKKELEEMWQKQKGEYEKKGLQKEVETTITVSGTVVTLVSRQTPKVQIEMYKEMDKNRPKLP